MSNVFREQLLAGKVAVVTGGGSGINQGIAERYAAMGAKVCILGRTQQKLDDAVAEMAGKGGTAMGLSADVRDFAALSKAFETVHEKWGEIDLVVAGAAGNFPAPAIGMSANGFKSVIDIDLLGTFNTFRAVFDHLRKPGASCIAISATQAQTPMAMQAHVCAAKAGVDMLVRSLAIEWGPAGVRLNCVTPGPVDGTEGMKRLAPTEEGRAKLAELLPLQRWAQRDEIADLCLFLSSDAARYMTGSIVNCDGGMSLIGSGAVLGTVMGG